ncbi:MAG: AbrB/MazE/SpoVT family DNA-binding domain-containing protein [Christensenellales bacterium]|jgi:transcriptional pleiotropic regulator of transition state genes
MKSTGMVRRVDDLGRIVLPMELRRTLGIHLHDAMEIYVMGEQILLTKLQDRCVFCQGADQLQDFRGKKVCAQCLDSLQRQQDDPD